MRVVTAGAPRSVTHERYGGRATDDQGGATITRTPSPVENDLVIVLTYYTPYVSGLTNVARDVAEGLAARGWRVCVVASKHDPALPTQETIRGVRVVRAPVLAKVGKGTVGVNLTRLALREMHRSRVANLHLPLIEAGLLTRLAPIPVVSTYHCDVSLPPGVVNGVQRAAVDRSSRGGLRRSVAAVVSTEDYARRSRLWPVIAPRMVAIPPPCAPVPAGSPSFRRGGGFHVGFLGRLVEEKGVEHLVDAFLALDDPDARLLVAGDHSRVAGGSVVDAVRAHAGDDPRIELLGFVPDDRLGDFYASVDAVALPSVNAFEAFGIVQVVGMLAGVPAVVSDLPGVRLPVERTGFGVVVPPGDVGALRDGLASLRDSPPDTSAGRAAAAAAFSVPAVLDDYEVVLTKAAGTAPSPTTPGAPRMTTDRDAGSDTGRDLAEVSRTWTRLGGADPMWAVLTDAGKRGNRWDPADFLATGVAEIAAVLERLTGLGVDPGRGRALDFGCGAGRLSHGLAAAGFDEVLGCDVSPTMLATARDLVDDPAVRFVPVTGADLAAVGTGSVDLVYCCRVLQHMPPALAHGYVREFFRIAAPGAAVVFQMPTRPAPSLAGRVLAALPAPTARALRRGMEMHGTPEEQVRALVAGLGGRVLAADDDHSAGPRWSSRLYLTLAPAADGPAHDARTGS